jgi:hypothetical protein
MKSAFFISPSIPKSLTPPTAQQHALRQDWLPDRAARSVVDKFANRVLKDLIKHATKLVIQV